MEEDRHRRLPRVHNAYAHVCKSFQVAIERSKSALVHLWQVLPYIIASLWFAVAFILSCHNAIVFLTPINSWVVVFRVASSSVCVAISDIGFKVDSLHSLGTCRCFALQWRVMYLYFRS